MGKVRSYITRFLILLLALQVLNLSVYGRDCVDISNANTIGEYNQMDSMAEYITEILLDYKNAFPENGGHSRRSSLPHQLKHITIKMVSIKKRTFEQTCLIATAAATTTVTNNYKYLFSREITPPPPKA